MSEENIEVVRSALDAWNRQDDEAALQLFRLTLSSMRRAAS